MAIIKNFLAVLLTLSALFSQSGFAFAQDKVAPRSIGSAPVASKMTISRVTIGLSQDAASAMLRQLEESAAKKITAYQNVNGIRAGLTFAQNGPLVCVSGELPAVLLAQFVDNKSLASCLPLNALRNRKVSLMLRLAGAGAPTAPTIKTGSIDEFLTDALTQQSLFNALRGAEPKAISSASRQLNPGAYYYIADAAKPLTLKSGGNAIVAMLFFDPKNQTIRFRYYIGILPKNGLRIPLPSSLPRAGVTSLKSFAANFSNIVIPRAFAAGEEEIIEITKIILKILLQGAPDAARQITELGLLERLDVLAKGGGAGILAAAGVALIFLQNPATLHAAGEEDVSCRINSEFANRLKENAGQVRNYDDFKNFVEQMPVSPCIQVKNCSIAGDGCVPDVITYSIPRGGDPGNVGEDVFIYGEKLRTMTNETGTYDVYPAYQCACGTSNIQLPPSFTCANPSVLSVCGPARSTGLRAATYACPGRGTGLNSYIDDATGEVRYYTDCSLETFDGRPIACMYHTAEDPGDGNTYTTAVCESEARLSEPGYTSARGAGSSVAPSAPSPAAPPARSKQPSQPSPAASPSWQYAQRLDTLEGLINSGAMPQSFVAIAARYVAAARAWLRQGGPIAPPQAPPPGGGGKEVVGVPLSAGSNGIRKDSLVRSELLREIERTLVSSFHERPNDRFGDAARRIVFARVPVGGTEEKDILLWDVLKNPGLLKAELGAEKRRWKQILDTYEDRDRTTTEISIAERNAIDAAEKLLDELVDAAEQVSEKIWGLTDSIVKRGIFNPENEKDEAAKDEALKKLRELGDEFAKLKWFINRRVEIRAGLREIGGDSRDIVEEGKILLGMLGDDEITRIRSVIRFATRN